MIGQSISLIRAFVATDSKGTEFAQVRIQLDEKNSRNEYVLREGQPFTARTDDGVFDENDELVLRTEDVGPCVEMDTFVKNINNVGVSKISRLELSDAAKSLGCYFVLSGLAQVKAKPLRMIQKIEFSPNEGLVKTADYRYVFHKIHPVMLGEVGVMNARGEYSPMIESANFAFNFSTEWFLPSFRLDSNNFHSEIECWQSGPIRSIVAVGVKLKNLLSIFNMHMFSELVFYEDAFQIPSSLDMKINAAKYLRKGSGIGYGISFAQNAGLLNHNLKQTLLDRSAQELWDAGERALTGKKYTFDLAVEDKVLSVSVAVDHEILQKSLPPLLHRSAPGDAKTQPSWDWLKALGGEMQVFVDFSALNKGQYNFGLDLLLGDRAGQKAIEDIKSFKTAWSPVRVL